LIITYSILKLFDSALYKRNSIDIKNGNSCGFQEAVTALQTLSFLLLGVRLLLEADYGTI
jgi:hypothetical protein